MPAFDLAQDRFESLDHRFGAFAGILNFDGLDGHRVGEAGLTFREVELAGRVNWHFGMLVSQFSLGLSDQGLYVEGVAIFEALTRFELDTREGQGIRQVN